MDDRVTIINCEYGPAYDHGKPGVLVQGLFTGPNKVAGLAVTATGEWWNRQSGKEFTDASGFYRVVIPADESSIGLKVEVYCRNATPAVVLVH